VPTVMAGDPDLRLGPKQRPPWPNVSILLAQMDAIGADPLRQLHAVVNDESHASVATNSLERLGDRRKLVFGDVLHSKLEGDRKPRFERRLQTLREAASDLLRGNQIEPRRASFRAVECGSELLRYSFVQSQAGTFSIDAS
jgi:hypothetical protein